MLQLLCFSLPIVSFGKLEYGSCHIFLCSIFSKACLPNICCWHLGVAAWLMIFPIFVFWSLLYINWSTIRQIHKQTRVVLIMYETGGTSAWDGGGLADWGFVMSPISTNSRPLMITAWSSTWPHQWWHMRLRWFEAPTLPSGICQAVTPFFFAR